MHTVTRYLVSIVSYCTHLRCWLFWSCNPNVRVGAATALPFRRSDRPDSGAVDAPAARSRIASLTRARSARSPCAPVRGQSSRACFSSERPFHDPPLPPCLRRHLLCSAPRPAHRLLLERG